MLTKSRGSSTSNSSMYGPNCRRRLSPLALIGIGVTALIAIAGVFVVITIARTGSHAADAAVNPNCTLVVPANPLSATGLATPYQLFAPDAAANGPCNEANANQSAFVQGVIYNPATGAFSIYNPLVVDKGTQAAVAPTAPALPANAVVGLWFGFNGTNLTLQGANGNALRQAQCVNGTNGSVFGQFAYCNAPTFFQAANRGIAAGKVTVPALGTGLDGKACLSTRDFGQIDQDQSDNVQTQYIANGNGQTAQFSAANQAAIANGTAIANPSDNALLTAFVDPALGCKGWTAPDLANNNAPASALALDEIQAAADQQAPVALVPLTDPMTMIARGNNNVASLTKTNLYRAGSDQKPAANQAAASGTTYCKNFLQTGIPRIALDEPLTVNATTPAADQANSLFTFLAMRAMQSYVNLNCQALLNVPNPVTTTTDGNGVTIGATITINGVKTTGGTVTAGAGNGNAGAGNGGTTTTNTATGTVNAALDAGAGNAQVALSLNIANFANKQFFVNITNSATNTQILNQAENTDGNGANNASTVINGLQGVTVIPNTWVATITDVNGKTLGSANFVSNGANAVATLTATSNAMTMTCPTAAAATPAAAATTCMPAGTVGTNPAAGKTTPKNAPYNARGQRYSNGW